MKKSTIFLLGVGLLSTCFGGFTFAAFSVTDNADPFSVKISVEAPKRYYVKTFASAGGAETHSYEMSDNTSSMSPETDKVAEYILQNVSLTKDEVLKGWSTGNVWHDTFEHSWSNDVSKDGDDNYIVPMTSTNYTFYLKIYSDNTSKFYITAEKNVFFFKPNSAWADASATFSLWQYNNNTDGIWTDFTIDTNGFYKVSVSKSMFHVVRFGTNPPSHDWAQKWGESGDFTVANLDTNNAFELSSSAVGDNFNGWGPSFCSWTAR